jgi:ribonuclease III
MSDLQRLQRHLGYTFRNPDLLELALSHRSVGRHNNERLEFLGDAALGFIVGEMLYHHFPQAAEGQLSRLRATLVRRESLAERARGFNLGDYLKLGPGELKSGGFRRDSILADAFEALLGAILLDSDLAALRSVIETLFLPALESLSLKQTLKDPKSRLQEHLQQFHLPLPVYEVIETSGMPHQQQFRIRCTLAGRGEVIAEGSNRRNAEQEAAAGWLERLAIE